MPVNTAQPFIAKHGARTSGKGLVIEHLLVKVVDVFFSFISQRFVLVAIDAIECGGEKIRIFKGWVEVDSSRRVLINDALIARLALLTIVATWTPALW